MVALTDIRPGNPTQDRLSIQTAEIAADSTVLRCLDWDRDRFDIEFELRNGTTYKLRHHIPHWGDCYRPWDVLFRFGITRPL